MSHSTWQDEKSVARWRTQAEHHTVQEKGRFDIFQDCRLRVGDVTVDSDPPRQAPILEQRLDETEVGIGKVATITEITPEKGATFAAQTGVLPAHLGLDLRNGAIIEHNVFESIYYPGKFALLIGWKNGEAANSWSPKRVEGVTKLRHRQVRVVREYGRFDRREAPQYYPDVKGGHT